MDNTKYTMIIEAAMITKGRRNLFHRTLKLFWYSLNSLFVIVTTCLCPAKASFHEFCAEFADISSFQQKKQLKTPENYLCTLPEASPPISVFTSATLT